MRNLNRSYVLHCGELQYEVTPDVEKTLKGVMYWTSCESLDRAELHEAEVNKREREKIGRIPAYTDFEIEYLRNAVRDEELSVRDFMSKMEKQCVPNWVGNAAMEWARNNDLRQHDFREFFEGSVYAKKSKES